MKKLKEGKIEFWVSDEVFYNPVMKLARDLSILVISAYQEKFKKKIKFGDVLAATGVRGLRMAKEVKDTKVLINDKDPKAFELIKQNIKLNKLTNTQAFNQDANIFVLANRPFDVIDIDPFGSPISFVGDAIQSLYKNGLLSITSTDTPVLVGLYPKTCYRRYGVKNFKTEYSKELGLRILLSHLARTAAQYDLYISPLIAHSTAHYFRIYCTVNHGAKKADQMLSNLGLLSHCHSCGYRELDAVKQPCPNCKGRLTVMRDLWVGKIWDQEFCELVLKENEKYGFSEVDKLLRLLLKDSKSPPLYYNIHKLCKKLKISPPKTSSLLNRLKENGFHASKSHFCEFCIKTNAPISELEMSLNKFESLR